MRLDSYEQLVSDRRLERATTLLALEFPTVGAETNLVTFIQPQREVTKDGRDLLIEQQAVFAAVSKNPRHPTFDLMTTGVMSFRDFQRAEAEFASQVGPDPLIRVFRKVIPQHADIIENLKALI